MKSYVALLTMMMSTTVAHASSTDAWARFNGEVTRGCVAASGLGGARASEVMGFDDTLGKVAVLVTGRETVRARRGTTTVALSKLCIYDKKSKRTWVQEASGWSAPPAR